PCAACWRCAGCWPGATGRSAAPPPRRPPVAHKTAGPRAGRATSMLGREVAGPLQGLFVVQLVHCILLERPARPPQYVTSYCYFLFGVSRGLIAPIPADSRRDVLAEGGRGASNVIKSHA